MKQVLGRIVKYLVLAVYAVCGLALLTFMVPATGFLAKSVLTGSMQPAIPVGSLVIIHKTSVNQLAVGDIVTYKKASTPDVTITHRIASKELKSGIPYFITKGDANAVPDAPVPGGMILGKVIFHAPYIGGVTGALKTPAVLIFLVILPGLVIIITESRRLQQMLKTPATPTAASNATAPTKPEAPEDPPADVPPTPLVTHVKVAPKPTRRRIDNMTPRRLVVMLVGVVLLCGVGTTLAARMTNTVTLAGTKLSVGTPGPTLHPTPTPRPTPTPKPTPTPRPADLLKPAVDAFKGAVLAATNQYQTDVTGCETNYHPGSSERDFPTRAQSFNGRTHQAETNFQSQAANTSMMTQGSSKYGNYFSPLRSQVDSSLTTYQDQLTSATYTKKTPAANVTTLKQCLKNAQNKYMSAIDHARDQLLAAIRSLIHG